MVATVLVVGLMVSLAVTGSQWACYRTADAQVRAVFLGMNQLLVDELDVRQLAESEGYDARAITILEDSRAAVMQSQRNLCADQPAHWLCGVDLTLSIAVQNADATVQAIRQELESSR